MYHPLYPASSPEMKLALRKVVRAVFLSNRVPRAIKGTELEWCWLDFRRVQVVLRDQRDRHRWM